MNNTCCNEPKKLYEEDGTLWAFCGNCLESIEDNEGSE